MLLVFLLLTYLKIRNCVWRGSEVRSNAVFAPETADISKVPKSKSFDCSTNNIFPRTNTTQWSPHAGLTDLPVRANNA